MLHKQHLDFEILDTGNAKTLVFLDSSDYFEDPDRPLLQILLPGYTKYYTTNVVARKLNTFNSNTIGYSEGYTHDSLVNLPDGVWTLSYRICPYDTAYKQKYHLRTVLLEQKLDRLFEFIDVNECEDCGEVGQQLIDIIVLIEAGKAAARRNQPKRASDAYDKANTRATKIFDKLYKAC